jgi:hypothetical protein
LSKRSGGALETQRWLVGDGSANPGGGGGGGGDGCLVDAVVLGVQVGRRGVEGAEGAQSGEGGRRELGVRGVRWAVLGAHDGANGLREDPKPIFSDSMSLRRKSTVVIGWLEIT